MSRRVVILPIASLTIAIAIAMQSTWVMAEQAPIEVVVVSGSHQKTNLMALRTYPLFARPF